jgi:hypothetical protein
MDLNTQYLSRKFITCSAQVAITAFSIGLLIFEIKIEAMNMRIIHFATFLFAIKLSRLFGLVDNNIGIIQRAMYLGSFAWCVFFTIN